MRILFLHEVSYLEKPIFEMHEFPEFLATQGHEVFFLDFQEQETSFGRPKIITGQIEGRVFVDARLTLLSAIGFGKGILSRLSVALFGLNLLSQALRVSRPDVIVTYAVPTFGWQACILGTKAGIPVMYRALDISHKIRKSRFNFLVQLAEKYVAEKATWVSANNEALRRYLVPKDASSTKSSADYPRLDTKNFEGDDLVGHPRPESGRDHRPVVVYLGTFFYFSGLDAVIESLGKLDSRPFKLVLIGGGVQEARLRKLTSELGLNGDVHFAGYVPYNKLREELSAAKVAINPMVPSLVANKALPNKVLQYVASGIPVVSTRLEGLSQIFPEGQGVVYVEREDQIVNRVIQLLAESAQELLAQGSARIQEIFANGKPEAAFELRLKKLVNGAN